MGTKEVKKINEIPTKEYAETIFPKITDGYTHTAEYYEPIYDLPTDHGTVRPAPFLRTDIDLNILSRVIHLS